MSLYSQPSIIQLEEGWNDEIKAKVSKLDQIGYFYADATFGFL